MVDRESRCALASRNLLTGNSMFLIVATWFISARHWFKGPVINVEVRTLHIRYESIQAHHISMQCSDTEDKLNTLTVSRVVPKAKVPASTRRAKDRILI